MIKHELEKMCFIRDSSWISDDDCLKHSSDWQYWENGKNHCLGCLRNEVSGWPVSKRVSVCLEDFEKLSEIFSNCIEILENTETISKRSGLFERGEIMRSLNDGKLIIGLYT